MKIGSYTADANGNIPSIKQFKPTQVLLFDLHNQYINALGQSVLDSFGVINFQNLDAKINLTLQDSASGSQTTVIPFVRLNLLSEIATMHEGVVLFDEKHMLLPVLLHPTSSLRVDSNKYLDIQLSGLKNGQTVDVYSLEGEQLSEMVCVYQKFSVPAGCARQSYAVGSNDILAFPTDGFDSLRMIYNTGVVSDFTKVELSYLMAKNNDMTAYSRTEQGGVNITEFDFGAGSYSQAEILLSHGYNFILDLAGVKSFEFIRDTDPSDSFEFVTGDLH